MTGPGVEPMCTAGCFPCCSGRCLAGLPPRSPHCPSRIPRRLPLRPASLSWGPPIVPSASRWLLERRGAKVLVANRNLQRAQNLVKDLEGAEAVPLEKARPLSVPPSPCAVLFTREERENHWSGALCPARDSTLPRALFPAGRVRGCLWRRCCQHDGRGYAPNGGRDSCAGRSPGKGM